MTNVKVGLGVAVFAALMTGCASAAYGSVETGSGTTLVAGARQGFWNSSGRVWSCPDTGAEQCKQVEVEEVGK
jgi:hypothetical protein